LQRYELDRRVGTGRRGLRHRPPRAARSCSGTRQAGDRGHARAGPGPSGESRYTGPGARPETPGNPSAHEGHQPDADKGQGHDRATATAGRPTVGDQLTRNTNLTARLQTLFPNGTDLQKESAGFRNLGQFVAAAHVSHNLDIPWSDMKAKMTGDHPVSLGKAIQDLKPQADAKSEAGKAEKEADTDIKDASKNTSAS
jgi:hypothetical protein